MDKQVNPIKRSKALVQYSREHHFGLLLVWKIRQGLKANIEPQRISDYVQFFFEQELNAHFKSEEVELFVKLPVDDVLRIQAFDEHEVIYKLVKDIAKDKHSIALLNQFADTLESHIRFEERVLFNHLQEYLSASELESLEAAHNKRSDDIDTAWSDHFWLKK